MQGDIIKDTAERLNVEPKALFYKASVEKGWTNAEEVANYRFLRWFKYGEVPEWVTDYALKFWRSPCVSQHSPSLH